MVDKTDAPGALLSGIEEDASGGVFEHGGHLGIVVATGPGSVCRHGEEVASSAPVGLVGDVKRCLGSRPPDKEIVDGGVEWQPWLPAELRSGTSALGEAACGV